MLVCATLGASAPKKSRMAKNGPPVSFGDMVETTLFKFNFSGFVNIGTTTAFAAGTETEVYLI